MRLCSGYKHEAIPNVARIRFPQFAYLKPRTEVTQNVCLHTTLLPDVGKEVLHTCQEILAEETGTRRDLRDQPLEGPGLLTWYTDGSSYIMGGPVGGLQALYIHSLQRQHLLGCITHRKPWPVLLPLEIQPGEPQSRQLTRRTTPQKASA
ncbi:hypothetical protein MUG91_G8n46 [Manis pentadactyla]|nr:hypothetical protein MUG91_G8n46 [Manis pentadactyla]